ncbi:MAG: MBL fold metallo-hydrolase [Verrucomicrobiota bacterium JB022]|nr:MBL fold metallo-hydrolase [Verrucomicrobiota bacterium JB022]
MSTLINRRDALRWGLGLSGAFALSNLVSAAPPKASQEGRDANGAGIYHRPLGEFSLWTVSDGFGAFPVYPTFGGRTGSKDAVLEAARRWHLSDPVYNNFMMLVVRTPDALVLIDTGNGEGRGENSGKLLARLKQLGFAPKDFTHVIITHAHPDHLWGAVSKGKSVFSEAKYFIGQAEMRFWNRSDAEIRQAPEQMRGMLTTTRDALRVLEPQVKQVKDGEEVLPGFTMLDMPGHTPGHMGVQIRSGGETLYHVADIANQVRLLFEHPEWDFSYDNDPEQATATRRRVLGRIAEERALIFGTHYTFPGFGYVNQTGEGFEYIPEPIQFGGW